MSSGQTARREQGQTLVNRPESKHPQIPQGTKLIKRPLPNLSIVRHLRKARASHAPTTDLDGYQLPPRAAHTVLIKVTAKTPLVATIKRARKALDLAPGTQKTKGLPLTQRVESLAVNTSNSKEQSQGCISDALDDVVLVATGKAIERAFQAAFILRRNKELIVIFRTRTVSSIDDIVMDDDDDEADVDMEDQVRVRHMSCVEIGVRWK